MIYGHQFLRQQLEESLRPVTLLRGPSSVGKRALSLHLLDHHGAKVYDRMVVDRVDVDAAREVTRFVSTAPVGHLKGVVLDMDTASETSQNILLKTLEEPPRSSMFLLHATGPLLPTVESRCDRHHLGLLSCEDITAILTAGGMHAEAALAAAKRSDGTVASALDPGPTSEAKAMVLSAMRAVADRDPDKLEAALAKWDDDCHATLKIYLTECITTQWRHFQMTDTFGLIKGPHAWLFSSLRALGSSARPRLAARRALQAGMSRKA